jgi:drug/metabolite transporter (DMT)-like permease
MGRDVTIEPMGESRPTAHTALPAFICAILFAGSFVAGKIAADRLGPLTITFLRYVIALTVLVVLLGWQSARPLTLRMRDVPSFIFLGVTGIVGYHYFFFRALTYTAVANTAIINAINPVLTGLLAALFLKERIHRASYVGIAITVLGTVLLVANGMPWVAFRRGLNRGDMLMLAGVLSWSLYSLEVRRLSARYSGYAVTLFATVCGLILLIPLALAEGITRQISTIAPSTWMAIAYMGAAASGLGYLLYNISVGSIGPTRTAGIVNGTVPLLVAILALVAFAEPITLAMGVSGALVLTGLAVTVAAGRRGD